MNGAQSRVPRVVAIVAYANTKYQHLILWQTISRKDNQY